MAETPSSLYDRAGGEEGVRSLITNFYARVRRDPELGPFFEQTSMEKLERMQFEFFSSALGGPVQYTGCPLAHAHHGRGITTKHFALFVEHLLETLKSLDLTDDEIQEIISRLDLDADEITGGDAGLDG